MVFTSLPAAYFDPSNWQQQPNQQQQTGATTVTASTQQLPPPPPPLPPHGSGGAGSIRPGSMADRARLANIPMPETALKCPRCESTNTKFCYFNNYSLTQPRHFCKTCRRYWTRGGALRTVPVGGGCRRNKRSKSSSSKSPVSGERPTGSGSTGTVSSNTTESHDILGLGGPQVPSLRFMAPLHHHLSEFADIGFGYNSIAAPIGANDLNCQIGSALASAGGSLMSVGGLEQWRLQQQQQHQFPFSGGLDSFNSSSHSSGVYPFDHGGMEGSSFGLVRPKLSSPGATQLASVKMENSREHQLSRQFIGNMNILSGNDNQYWNTGNGTASNNSAWTDLSSFSSSSTSNNPM